MCLIELYAGASFKLLLHNIEGVGGSGTVKWIFTSQLFQPFLDDDHLKRIQRAHSIDEIWDVGGKRMMQDLSDKEFYHKIYKAIKCRYDKNHPVVKAVEEIVAIHQNANFTNTFSTEDEGVGKGDYSQPRKAIERESNQAGVATPSESTATENQSGGEETNSGSEDPSEMKSFAPEEVKAKGDQPLHFYGLGLLPDQVKPFVNYWPPSP